MFILKNWKLREIIFPSFLIVLSMVTPNYSINYMKLYVPSEPHPANAMWIEPFSITTANIGDKFNITVFVNLTMNSFAWQIKLYFNSTLFSATKIGYTNGTKSDFFTEFSPIPVTPKIDNDEGYVLHGESLLGNDEKAPGYGSLIWIEFKVTQIPPQNHSTIYFSTPYGIDTFILTPYIDLIPMESVDGINISVKPTGLPSFPDMNILILIAIIVTIIIIMLVIMRKKRRKSKKHEKNED
ncbi:MAG: hypothetical protein ACFFAU_07890 [Candidatus Hodarchaeota archaeon]